MLRNGPISIACEESGVPNPFVHLELNTTDLPKAQQFFRALFGWEFQDTDMGPHGIYSTFKPDTGPGGGMVSMTDGFPGWSAYVGVDDIKASTEKARELGATILFGPQEIPNVGWMTVFLDPTGSRLALFQAK